MARLPLRAVLRGVKRGEIWTFAGGATYHGKPRPAVVLQADAFDTTASVTICGFTSDDTEAPLLRVPVEPSESNGLRSPSRLMVDKISTVPRNRAGYRVGRLDAIDVVRLERAILVFLGMAGTAAD